MALINRKALAQTTGLAGDDILLVLQENVKQTNAGNKGITVDNFVTAIESRIDDVVGDLEVTGVLTVTDTTDSTDKDTGSIITEGGIGVEKSIGLGANLLLQKEVDHSIAVTTTTTVDTVGGGLNVIAGAGNGSGAGGQSLLKGGRAGVTGNGGATSLYGGTGGNTSGDGGSASVLGGDSKTGNSGAVILQTQNPTTAGNSGDITAVTGNGVGATGKAGDFVVTPGTSADATLTGKSILVKGLVRKPLSSSVASGGTITGKQLVDGLITATGATGNWQLPTAAQITTAIGATPAGTNFEFVFNATGMTAANTATLLVGSNMTVASSPAITGGGALTITQGTQVTAGFRVVYDSSTTCKIYRVW
jgi:hypothetical protein